jgi:hypothetical protein
MPLKLMMQSAAAGVLILLAFYFGGKLFDDDSHNSGMIFFDVLQTLLSILLLLSCVVAAVAKFQKNVRINLATFIGTFALVNAMSMGIFCLVRGITGTSVLFFCVLAINCATIGIAGLVILFRKPDLPKNDGRP